MSLQVHYDTRPGHASPTLIRRKTLDPFELPTLESEQIEQEKVPVEKMYLGLAVHKPKAHSYDIGIAIHDGTYSIDYAVIRLDLLNRRSGASTPAGGSGYATPLTGTATPISGIATPMTEALTSTEISDCIAEKIVEYRDSHNFKFIGAGLTAELVLLSPGLPAMLWSQLDIVPMVFAAEMSRRITDDREPAQKGVESWHVDDEADSIARKAIRRFGGEDEPRIEIGRRNRVKVDSDRAAQITDAKSLEASVHPNTWKAMMYFANSLRHNGTKIAFFNTTPQGGGVALMRHALVRLMRIIGVDCQWYCPKPRAGVFRITKNNHNILQGVADPDVRLDDASKAELDDWCLRNAHRYWTAPGQPLASPAQGGSHVIIIDDPQMPSLVDIAKQQDPDRPVIFRSHIQVRADLADQEGTPTSEVWNWVWDHVKNCDVFVSHPVKQFVPKNVTVDKIGYHGATTDWLDGLNKKLQPFDNEYYMRVFESNCLALKMTTLKWPKRKYIVQIARFDPAKGIPDVLASYAKLRREYMHDWETKEVPQLCIAGHGAIDDPDAQIIFDQTIESIAKKYPELKQDIVVMRLGPSDQMLNVLMANAHVALQLSTREGFEVKVSEALHMGTPCIATTRGGIPLQVVHEKSGFLVAAGQHDVVARHLFDLFTNKEKRKTMSEYAATHVSDEVSTVGNALAWLYLADTLAKGEALRPKGKWITEMAREAAGVPWAAGENKLNRGLLEDPLDESMGGEQFAQRRSNGQNGVNGHNNGHTNGHAGSNGV